MGNLQHHHCRCRILECVCCTMRIEGRNPAHHRTDIADLARSWQNMVRELAKLKSAVEKVK